MGSTQDQLTPSNLATIPELNGGDFFEAIAGLGCPTQGWILVDALLLLFVGFEVLTDPCPEFAASAGGSSAEEHTIKLSHEQLANAIQKRGKT